MCFLGPIPAPAFSLTHQVVRSDTLFGLAIEYQVPIKWIIRANNLENETIKTGQKLEIPVDGNWEIVVKKGDTLSGIAWELGIDPEQLRESNRLKSDILRIGQRLTLPAAVPEGKHIVQTGDTLIGIARNYNIKLEELRRINNITNDNGSDVIYPGEILKIPSSRPEIHRVQEGESLWLIARNSGVSTDQIKAWNSLSSETIHPGQTLALYPNIDVADVQLNRSTDVALASTPVTKPTIPQQGEYFFSAPEQENQPSALYWESASATASTDYKRARQILGSFDNDIAAMRRESTLLRGWHVVIDPGHGGLDPGAIVSVPDGNGNPLVITEDEYAYDIALRLYRALTLNGASVSLTILAPDHHVRNGENARQTFVHRKNEVYNFEQHNKEEAWRPIGSSEGLEMRKMIAAKQISEADKDKKIRGSIFVSIHADNSSDLPEGSAVLFDGNSPEELETSRKLASAMVPELGSGAFTRRQALRVLQDNPADAAVLVEARNIRFPRNAWALRSAELREQDARMISQGILAWVSLH